VSGAGHTGSGRTAFSNGNASASTSSRSSCNTLMRNGTFLNSERQNPSDAVAFCAARAFLATAIPTFPRCLISFSLAIFRKRRAPCGTRRTHPASNHNDFSLQLEMLSAVASRNHFSRSDFLFSQDSISKSVASDGPHDQCWSNCTPANALHVLSNRTQGKWLSFFARQHLISPAKVFPNCNAGGLSILRRKNSGQSRSTVDDELDVFGKVSGHFGHDVASEKLDH